MQCGIGPGFASFRPHEPSTPLDPTGTANVQRGDLHDVSISDLVGPYSLWMEMRVSASQDSVWLDAPAFIHRWSLCIRRGD